MSFSYNIQGLHSHPHPLSSRPNDIGLPFGALHIEKSKIVGLHTCIEDCSVRGRGYVIAKYLLQWQQNVTACKNNIKELVGQKCDNSIENFYGIVTS